MVRRVDASLHAHALTFSLSQASSSSFRRASSGASRSRLFFFTFAAVASISYTSVLQRTFNLVVTALPAADSTEAVDHEFSMIDQADFAGIDAYVKRHGLNDESMAAQRKAKRLNINGVKGEPPPAGGRGR